MATLRNLRAYVPGTNASTVGDYASYDTASNESGNAILRKINLNVDIATQNELNEAFTTLSNAITATGTEWKQADIQLSNDLKAWAKGDELSGALHNEITAEANRASTAEQEISAALTAWNVTVDKAEETSSYVYTIKQGGVAVEGGTIDIAKDIFVTSADFEGTILILHLANGQVISTDLSGLVDQYTGGTTDFATVDITDNVVKAYVSADLISAAAVTTVVGQGTDLSTADTINGVRAYVDEKVTGKNVAAEGDVYVSASAADNKVTVAATADLCAAVELAEGAVQSVAGDGTILTATEGEGGAVTVSPTSKLTTAVAAAETALQSIAAGTDGTYVTTTVPAKGEGETTQTVAVALTFGELSAGTSGVAKAEEAKAYVDAAVAGKNVDAEGDGLINATAANNKVTVQATDALCAVVSKVEGTSATWDAALQSVAGSTGSFVTITATEKASNSQTIGATVTTHDISSAVASTADGLAIASDVKAYVDTVSAAIAVTATGDNYVSAWVENGKDVKLAAKDKLTAVVNVVENTSATWNDALQLSDVATGTTDGTIKFKSTDVAVAGLQSAAYTLSTAYDKAGDAAALQTAIKATVNDARFDISATDDYADIDAIIADLVKVRQALGALKALNVTLTPAQA